MEFCGNSTLAAALCGFWVKSRAKNKSTLLLRGVWKRPPVHTHVLYINTHSEWTREPFCWGPRCSTFLHLFFFFKTFRHIYHIYAGWGRDVFWHRWWQWEVYNESRAAWPHCYLFHYLNNGSSTVGLTLCCYWIHFCYPELAFGILAFSVLCTLDLLHSNTMIGGPGCNWIQSDLCTNAY